MIKIIRTIGMSALVAGLGLLVTPIARAQDSVFVTSTGDVGIGTSTPTARLDVQVNAFAATARLKNAHANGYPGIEYMDENGVVNLFFGLDNAANTTRLNSINNNPIVILTESTERMRVTSTGNVGIGSASPNVRFEVKASANGQAAARLQSSSATGYPGIEYLDNNNLVNLYIGLDNANANTRFNSVNNYPIVILTNSTERIRFPSPGGNYITAANGASLTAGGIWTDASSRDFKKDIVNLDAAEALTAIRKLDPVKFQYKSEPGEQYLGFIAEDVPELVARNDHKSLSPMDIVAVLTKVVQEQQKKIDELTAKMAELQQKVQ